MSLRPALRPAINCLHSFVSLQMRNRLVLRTSIRCLSHKSYGKSLDTAPAKDEKDLVKERVFLKDENGEVLGVKSLIESKLLAQKMRMNLIEDKEDNNHKYKCFKMVSNKYLLHLEEKEEKSIESNHSTGSSGSNADTRDTRDTKGVKEVKHLVFSTKLSENDLMTKINQIKRWLSRGHQIAINVTNHLSDTRVLVNILHICI